MEWLKSVTAWLLDLVKQLITAIWDFFYDVAVRIVEALLGVVATVINAFGAPDFMVQYSLSSLVGGVGNDILYFVGVMQIIPAFGIIGAAWGFRLLRKAFTLGQW